jgi:N-acetylneuraminate synthase/N,N'-diacetyllegionaminate synthase
MNFARVLIIAEAGVNHNGDLEIAKRLIAEAAEAGADAVKFQTFRADEVASPQAATAEYQIRNLRSFRQRPSQRDVLCRLELDRSAHFALATCAKDNGILFLSSPFDWKSADLLEEVGVPLFKLGSGELTNIPLLRHVGRKRKPVILSTGMATLEEVGQAVRVLQAEGNDDIVLMHCVTQYPAPAAQINLRAMQTMAATFHLPVGYSDHTEGSEIAFAAAALGACCIEKHFTLSRAMEGPDHLASAEPCELKAMVTGIRCIESALGDGVKRPAPGEMPNRLLVRRSLFAAAEIPAGTVLTAALLACQRPGTGIPSERHDDLIGHRAARRFVAGEMLDWDGLSRELNE